MKASKEQLLEFLERNVFQPAESNPKATDTIKKKVRATRMQLSKLDSAEKIEHCFWAAMTSDNGIDSYIKFKEKGFDTFEDVRADFKSLCGR